jgi:hypothetical protein
MSTIKAQTTLSKLRTRGYWRVVIRPTSFRKDQIPNDAGLFRIIERNSVRLRGWDYPHIDHQSQPLRGPDWAGQEFDCEDEIEVWRFHKSGQFVHFFAIAGDWRDQSTCWPAGPGWNPGRHMHYVQTLYSFLEIFEFAARLALSPAGAPSTRVEIDLKGLQGRQLISEDFMVPLRGTYATEMPEWNHRWEGSQTELIAWPRELAAEATQEFFARFGLQLSLDILAGLQARIGH